MYTERTPDSNPNKAQPTKSVEAPRPATELQNKITSPVAGDCSHVAGSCCNRRYETQPTVGNVNSNDCVDGRKAQPFKQAHQSSTQNDAENSVGSTKRCQDCEQRPACDTDLQDSTTANTIRKSPSNHSGQNVAIEVPTHHNTLLQCSPTILRLHLQDGHRYVRAVGVIQGDCGSQQRRHNCRVNSRTHRSRFLCSRGCQTHLLQRTELSCGRGLRNLKLTF
mmetsp:Transcript_90604/g.242672  ORF Transcript_90604/g.242672 Transcript_90604/m.242672 type:complete len:222 (+) Transcript_90604:671-1336(+)